MSGGEESKGEGGERKYRGGEDGRDGGDDKARHDCGILFFYIFSKKFQNFKKERKLRFLQRR